MPKNSICFLPKKWERSLGVLTSQLLRPEVENSIWGLFSEWKSPKDEAWNTWSRAIYDSNWNACLVRSFYMLIVFAFNIYAPGDPAEKQIGLHQQFSNFLLSVSCRLLKIIENLKSINFLASYVNICHIRNLNREIQSIY